MHHYTKGELFISQLKAICLHILIAFDTLCGVTYAALLLLR